MPAMTTPAAGHLVPLAMALGLAFVPQRAHSEQVDPSMPWRASVGGSYSKVGDTSPFIALHKPFARWNAFRVEATVGMIGKHSDAEPEDREHVGFVALGLARDFGRWEASFSVATTYPQTNALSSVGQFLSQLSYRVADGYAVRLGHMSNASTHGRNRGETFLALSVDL